MFKFLNLNKKNIYFKNIKFLGLCVCGEKDFNNKIRIGYIFFKNTILELVYLFLFYSCIIGIR